MISLQERIEGRQIRAARWALTWTQRELARQARVAPSAVRRMEASFDSPARGPGAGIERVVRRFERAGVELFYDGGPGVRFTRSA